MCERRVRVKALHPLHGWFNLVVLLLIAGAALLVAGAELLVRGASRIAAAAGISPLVIGLTVVAFGTSAPELAVSTVATFNGQSSIAVGNVVGSNIFNVLFILGISAMLVPLVVQKQVVRLELPIMVAVSFALLAVAANGNISRLDGILLVAGLGGYLFYLGRQGRAPEVAEGATGERRDFRSLALSAVIALAGLALLVLGSDWFVDGAVQLATALGVSEAVIGLTIIAAGTSLPELATSILASIRGERDIAVGNVVGSNIFNILGILGICAVLVPGGVSVDPAMLAFDIPVMIAVAVIALPILFTGMRISRAEGILFVAYYCAYTLFLILRATEHDGLAGFTRIMTLGILPLTLVAVMATIVLSLRRGRA